MSEFNIENEYQNYLERVQLNESEMHEQQKIQLRRTFYAASGQMLVLLKTKIAELDEDKAIEVLEDLSTQVLVFFDQEMIEEDLKKVENN